MRWKPKVAKVTQHSPLFPDDSLGVASVVVAVHVSVAGAGETADTAVVGIATETSLHDHSTVPELVSAKRRIYDHKRATR